MVKKKNRNAAVAKGDVQGENCLFLNNTRVYVHAQFFFCYWVIWVLYILWILSHQIYDLNTFSSCSVGCIFALLTTSFAVQKLFSLMCHLFIFAFVAFAFEIKSKSSLPKPMFSSRFMFSGLMLKSLIYFESLLFKIFIWLCQVLVAAQIFVAAWRTLVAVCGILFPDQESNLCSLHWKCGLNHWTTNKVPELISKVSFFGMWLFTFPRTVYWRPFPIEYSWLLCHKLIDRIWSYSCNLLR